MTPRRTAAQDSALDKWRSTESAPHDTAYEYMRDGDLLFLAVMQDEDGVSAMPTLVCHLRITPGGRIEQTDGVIQWADRT